LGIAEAKFGSEAVDGGTTVAKSFFDGAPENEADAIEIARDAGFVLAELSADFGEGLLVRVIQTQALFIAGIESGESGLQRADEKGAVAFTIGIGRLNGNGVREFLDGLRAGRFCLIVFEGFEAAPCADGIDVALSQNSAKPSLERAAPVEITEERAFAASAVGEAVEFSKEGIGEFAGVRGS
jgi:hypothetical protein